VPRPRKFGDLARPKPINIVLPGLGRGVGRDKDRFRTTSATKDPVVYERRVAMVRDLAGRMLFDLLRGVLDHRFSIVELDNAYRTGADALRRLQLAHAGKLVQPLLRSYIKQSPRADKAKTEARITRFLVHVGARGEALSDDEATAAQQRKTWLARVSTSELTATAVAEFLADLTSARHTRETVDASGATRNRYRAAIGGWCTWMVRHGHLDTHPTAFKRVEKYREADSRLPDLTAAEYAGYFRAMEAARPDLVVVFKLLVHTGADVGEVETREVRDFDLSPDAPRVRYRRTKTRTPERYVPLPAAVAAVVRGHLAAHGLAGTDRVFGMFTRAEIEQAHRIARGAIRRDDLRLKDLRHIAAITWRRAGADLQTVQERLGHATLNQTAIYTAFAPASAAEAAGAEAAAALLTATESVPDITPITRTTPAARRPSEALNRDMNSTRPKGLANA